MGALGTGNSQHEREYLIRLRNGLASRSIPGMRPRFTEQWLLDLPTDQVRDVMERFHGNAGRLELDQKRFAFGYTVVPEEADIVGRSTQCLIDAYALMKGSVRLQQRQLLRTMDAI